MNKRDREQIKEDLRFSRGLLLNEPGTRDIQLSQAVALNAIAQLMLDNVKGEAGE